MVVYPHRRLHRRTRCPGDPMRMADDPDDCQLLPEAHQGPQEVDPRCLHLRHLDHRDLCESRSGSHSHLWCFGSQQPCHQCSVQHHLLPPARDLCALILWRIRTTAACKLDKQARRESRLDNRSAQHLLHGIHPLPCELLVHGSYHRHSPCRSCHLRLDALSCHRHVRLCPGSVASIHPLRPLPFDAQVDA